MSSELKVRIADFRRAAQKLNAKGEAITVSSLAVELSCTTVYLGQVFSAMPWLREELCVLSLSDALYLEYRRAILAVVSAGVTPSYSSVAHKLATKESRVRQFVDRHPELLTECGVYSLSEEYAYDKVGHFTKRVKELKSLLRGKGVAFTISAYAAAYRVDRDTLGKVIEADDEIKELFVTDYLDSPRNETSADPHSKK